MDGGSVTLKLINSKSTSFSVEFCQTMLLQKRSCTHIPGSFLFNNKELPIRSYGEKQLLSAIRNLRFKDSLPIDQVTATKEYIQELIDFVESEEYLRIAALMG
jgi:hypothetical protein